MAPRPAEDPELERLRQQKLKRYQRVGRMKEKGLEWPAAPVEQSTADAVAFVKRYPVALLEFWAHWSKPCHSQKPIVDELAAQFWGDVAFARLDLERHPDARDTWGVTVLPTVIITKHAQEVQRIEGAATRARLLGTLGPFAAAPEERPRRTGSTHPPGAHGG